MTAPLIILAAGGTGGHVFPAEALAGTLLERRFRLALVTDKRGHAYGGVLGSLETHRIAAGGIFGLGLIGKARGAIDLALGSLQALPLLARLKPAAVVGFGGYASLPTMIAAILRKVPTALHEQNAVLGRANRMIFSRVDRIATSFPAVRFASGAKVEITGNPVRPAIAALRGWPYRLPEPGEPFRILVLGGSQGARTFSDVSPAALLGLPGEQQDRIDISQQCRPEDLDRVRLAYAGSPIRTELQSFFADVPQRLAAAHLVICRAGASTVAELTTIGRPAILVPYPHAIDDHQTANATAMSEAGAAWLMPQPDFTPATLGGRIAALIAAPETLATRAAAAVELGRHDASASLADLVARLTEATVTEEPAA